MARGPQLITIFWRDIPAQVNARAGASKHQVLLKPRFQKAIDRAAMVAGITSASDYVNEWRRSSAPVAADADLEALAEATAADLDQHYPLARLDEIVAAGGFDPASVSSPSDVSPTDQPPTESAEPT